MRSREHIEELVRASEDDLSSSKATKDVSSRLVLFRVMCTEMALEATSFPPYSATRNERERVSLRRYSLASCARF